MSASLDYNSWDGYGIYATNKSMVGNLEVMAKRLKPLGLLINSNGVIFCSYTIEWFAFLPRLQRILRSQGQ